MQQSWFWFLFSVWKRHLQNQRIQLVAPHNKERIRKMWIKELFLHIQRFFSFPMSPTHWANPTSCWHCVCRQGGGWGSVWKEGGGGARGKRWKMDAWGDRIMKMEPNSCTEVKPLRTCRRPEAWNNTFKSPPQSKQKQPTKQKISISRVPINLEKNASHE